MLIFFLKTQGRDRGYVERQEQQQIGDITFNEVRQYEDNKDDDKKDNKPTKKE